MYALEGYKYKSSPYLSVIFPFNLHRLPALWIHRSIFFWLQISWDLFKPFFQLGCWVPEPLSIADLPRLWLQWFFLALSLVSVFFPASRASSWCVCHLVLWHIHHHHGHLLLLFWHSPLFHTMLVTLWCHCAVVLIRSHSRRLYLTKINII